MLKMRVSVTLKAQQQAAEIAASQWGGCAALSR